MQQCRVRHHKRAQAEQKKSCEEEDEEEDVRYCRDNNQPTMAPAAATHHPPVRCGELSVKRKDSPPEVDGKIRSNGVVRSNEKKD